MPLNNPFLRHINHYEPEDKQEILNKGTFLPGESYTYMMEHWQRLYTRYSEWDPWPVTRLIVVLIGFGYYVDSQCAWKLTFHDLGAIACTLSLVFFIMVVVSGTLASLCLDLAMLVIYLVILCNQWFYDAANWILRKILRLNNRTLLALFGLCGEIVLFALSSVLLQRLFSHMRI